MSILQNSDAVCGWIPIGRYTASELIQHYWTILNCRNSMLSIDSMRGWSVNGESYHHLMCSMPLIKLYQLINTFQLWEAL